MNELIRQAQMMQQKMLRTQEEIGKKEVESSVGEIGRASCRERV